MHIPIPRKKQPRNNPCGALKENRACLMIQAGFSILTEGNMGFEIERKWLPEKGLVETIMNRVRPVQIEQAYLCREPVIRIRKEGDRYYMTYKGAGTLCREEANLPLNEAAYQELLPKHSGIVITKNRYNLLYKELFPQTDPAVRGPEGDLFMELDVFEGEHQGLVILEVEFDSKESAERFAAPDVFGRDVTGQKEYTNSYLSLGKS